ncbi:MAG TPA: phosphatidate cytidylyltransferase [Woeseiaceae bacterium]|nr:phosphatidate cytidylyltransferase [Woeseiaceae bacterium]
MLRERIVTAIIAFSALLVVLFILPPIAAELAIAAVIIAGAWEWSAFLGKPSGLIRIVYVSLIAACMAALGLLWPEGVLPLLQTALLWWLLALVWTFVFPTRIPLVGRWLCGILVLVPLYAALVLLYRVSPTLLLFALIIVWSADIGAYFFGKRFGRHKLAPAISPGKTWEGVLGGLLLVAALIVGRSFWVDSNLLVLLPFCLGVAAVSIIGDLTVSMFKRTAGLKDSGALFPGHGGVLDRIDSVAAAAPVFALGMRWVGLA